MREIGAETALVGRRVEVKTPDGRSLGRGTYVWQEEILLDTCRKAYGPKVKWELLSGGTPPQMTLITLSDTRLFNRHEGSALLRSEAFLKAGTRITLEKIERVGWNHGGYLAGMFRSGFDGEWWLLISELQLLEERPPHLRVVRS